MATTNMLPDPAGTVKFDVACVVVAVVAPYTLVHACELTIAASELRGASAPPNMKTLNITVNISMRLIFAAQFIPPASLTFSLVIADLTSLLLSVFICLLFIIIIPSYQYAPQTGVVW
jgi:hypothetical protein